MQKGVPASDWLKQSRKRLRLTQSDVAAYLTFRLKKSVNQARIAEIECGDASISAGLLRELVIFFKQVERLRRQGRSWCDVYPH